MLIFNADSTKKKVEESSTPKAKAPATPKKDVTPKKEPTPKKPKEAIVFNVLSHDTGAAIPVDVKYEGSEHSKLGKNGKYQHVIKFEAPSSFTLHKTVSRRHEVAPAPFIPNAC